MQTTILNILPDAPVPAVKNILSFRPFVNYLKNRINNGSKQKSMFFDYVIESFEKHPELLQPIEVHETHKHEKLLQLAYNTLAPIIEDEEKQYRAFCVPLIPVIFYSTNAFFSLITNIKTGGVRTDIMEKSTSRYKKAEKFAYALILARFYQLPSFFNSEIVHSLIDEKTGLTRYYKLDLDDRFIDISYSGELPDIKMELLRLGEHDSPEAIQFLEEKLPLGLFTFEGFGVSNLTDVTMEYAINNIRNIILDNSFSEEQQSYGEVISSLKTLIGSNDMEFGLLPVLQINNKLIFNETTCLNSMLIRTANKKGIAERTYMALAEGYLKTPRLIFFRDITDEDAERQIYLKLLKLAGVVSYALMPVFFNNKLAGVLEIYTTKQGLLDEVAISKLEPAIPLLAQLLKNNVDEFNNDVEKVIKEKFTAVQPSVQWKFNEVAWHHIRDTHFLKEKKELEEIIFDKVYPLYGAIDIRNSTEERNAALRRDMEIQFTALLKTLEELKEISGLGLIDEKIFNSKKWLKRITEPGFNQELKLNDFIENEITPFFIQLAETNQELNPVLEAYFRITDEKTGEGNENRRQLEASMTTVISSVNNYMDQLKDEVQKAYPCYFEKFRTDGVEYDIYIGQSIAPDRPFTDMYLKNLRLLQVRSMAAIVKRTHALKDTLARPVETTQLIFIHAHPIDIKFRNDEKRFDVEGTYNIRYHIIKKRIDKVRVRDTKDRLTQPGKIAMVYFNQKEADEYRSYIKYLQGDGVLKNDLEYLDLEDLQGVNGLKALRVGVNVD
ncbi:MAG: GAF domain-containing protein [Agriterribacter sp.]